MNPLKLMKMKDRLELFRNEHPKVAPFFHVLKEEGLQTGSVLELRVTTPDGQERVTNIRLTDNDIETLKMLGSKDQSRD